MDCSCQKSQMKRPCRCCLQEQTILPETILVNCVASRVQLESTSLQMITYLPASLARPYCSEALFSSSPTSSRSLLSISLMICVIIVLPVPACNSTSNHFRTQAWLHPQIFVVSGCYPLQVALRGQVTAKAREEVARQATKPSLAGCKLLSKMSWHSKLDSQLRDFLV